MSDIDEKIQRELQGEASAIDELLAQEGGLPDMVAAAFKGGMRRWVWITSVITLVATVLMFWTGYEFYIAENTDDRIFWGIWFLASATVQIALKQWQWMEMNRSNLMREIKRLELAVATLAKRGKQEG